MKNILAAAYKGLFRFEITVGNITEDLEFQYPVDLQEGKEYILRKLMGKMQFVEKGTVNSSVKVKSPNGEVWNIVATDLGEVKLQLNEILNRFISRVESDGGSYQPNGTASIEIDRAIETTRLLLTPSAVKPGKIYSILPEDGSGDLTVERNSPAWYWDKNLVLRKADINTPRIDWKTGTPKILVEKNIKENKFFESEPVAAEGSSGGITYEVFDLGIGITNCVRFLDNAATRYRYGGTVEAGKQYTMGFFVKMDDGSEPIIDQSTDSGDFGIVIGGASLGVVSKEHIKNGVWYVSAVRTPSANLSLNGVIKYTGNTGKGFRCSGFMLIEGNYTGSYIQSVGGSTLRLADNIALQTPENISKIIEYKNEDEKIVITDIPLTYNLSEGLLQKIEMT